jgi:hypothetical protein
MGGFLSDTLAKYRFLTGDPQYDALLRSDASGYVTYRLTGDRVPLVRQLLRNAEAFRSNWEAYTGEMRWTDRVMSFTGNYLRYLPRQAPPTPSPETLYSTVTGDPGNPLVFPLNVVRWRTEPGQIAVLVTDSGPDWFAAELFHFGTQARPMGAEWYLLRPGRYVMSLYEKASGRQVSDQGIEVGGPRTGAKFELPSRVLCVLRIRPADR